MPGYKHYLTQRLMTYVVIILFTLSINFIIPRSIPGDPIRAIFERMSSYGQARGGEELVMQWRAKFGLDKDLFTQFVCYLAELFRGNLGYSIINFPTTVSELIARSIPWTIGLLATTTITSWLLGSLLGAIAGWKGGKWRALFPLAVVLGHTPYYLLALILVFLLAFVLPIFPFMGAMSPGATPSFSFDFMLDVIRHATLPALAVILSSLGWWFLSMRSMMVVLKGEDYILMAEAKGLGENTIMVKYALRNCLLPQVTGLALSLGNIFGGALVTEMIFAYPGVGWLLYYSIVNLDYPVIQGIVLMVILSVCSSLLIIDLMYPLIDPKIKYIGE